MKSSVKKNKDSSGNERANCQRLPCLLSRVPRIVSTINKLRNAEHQLSRLKTSTRRVRVIMRLAAFLVCIRMIWALKYLTDNLKRSGTKSLPWCTHQDQSRWRVSCCKTLKLYMRHSHSAKSWILTLTDAMRYLRRVKTRHLKEDLSNLDRKSMNKLRRQIKRN